MPSSDGPWLLGCGSADVTGEPWGAGMMGYGMRFQRTTGVHLRQRSRAFVIGDPTSGRRLVLVVADIGMFFANVRAAVLARLDPAVVRPEDLVLTATHTHAGPGGFSGYRMYNTTNKGLRRHTFDAVVDGVVASIHAALADAAPGRLVLGQGALDDASVNRSPEAFARNPAEDRQHFPAGIDPLTTVLRFERAGQLVGVVSWFATHGTSLTNRNTLISGDNKGYAAWAWERLLSDAGSPAVAAFAQTNSGDLSPNVPDATQGPTSDEVENTRIIGERQLLASQAAAAGGSELAGPLETRLSYIDLPGLDVRPEFSPDGRPHRLGRAVLGAAFAAGTKEGRGVGFCHEGVAANPLLSACSGLAFRLRPQVGQAHSPKAMLLPVGALGWVAERVPVQLVRIGPLVLVALAQEVTIVAGLRLRRAVAEVLDVPLETVLVQGYANDYAGYVTTPEEYDAQRYEGGHTMFGRWQLPAYVQEVTRVALDMRDARAARPGPPPMLRPPPEAAAAAPDATTRCSGVRTQPADGYAAGDLVVAEVEGDDPRGPARDRYLLVQAQRPSGWESVARDGDWSATVQWRKDDVSAWVTTLSWRIPAGTSGVHRLVFVDRVGTEHATRPFTV
ncbi:MAG: neutral/alkaline non-lysosomal ceramidase N-terminal domain-containing protein [Mycobacteriales bacterium]